MNSHSEKKQDYDNSSVASIWLLLNFLLECVFSKLLEHCLLFIDDDVSVLVSVSSIFQENFVKLKV